MADIDLPLTFTVEFELVFAFHESLLQAHLNAAHPGAAIVKNLTPAQRIDLNQVPTHYLNTIGSYAGWALTGSSTSRAAKRSIDGTIRTYGDEPLHVANGMLPGRLAYVYQGPDQARDFTRWELSHNPNLIGVDMQTLQRKLGDRIPDLTAANYWDSQGLNLTSPPLPISATSFAEIATTLAALTGHSTSLHGALTTPLCGTHVQVGLPPGSSPRAFPLLTLQHLAYILTMYESHISAMHAPHRQDNAAADLGSNRRTAFALDPARVVAKAVFDPVTRTVTRRNRWVYTPSLAEIRAAVFAPEMTLEGLVALMGGVEGLFVNWAGLLRPEAEGPPTLVFRQHEGSLYGASVKWWVLFVTGLVGLAHRLASEAGVDAGSGESEAGVKGFAFEEWHDNMSFVDLFEMMGFPLEGRRFLGSRVAFYAGGLERGRDETPGSGSGSWNGGDEREGTLLGKRGWDDDDGDEADLLFARRHQQPVSSVVAGPQRPLQTLPESRLLGVKAHPEPINVFVRGAQDVGKTALIVRYCIDSYVTDYDPHQDTWTRRRTFHETPFLLAFDEVPASWVLKGNTPKEMLQRADALLFAYDVGDRASFKTMKAVCEKVLASVGEGEGEGVEVPVGIVATKADTPAGKWQVGAGDGREFAGRVGGVFGACSAKEGRGVVELVEGTVMAVVEGKVRLVREREERFRGRVEMYRGRAGGGGKAARVVGKVGR